jgi:MFS family permease
MTQEALISARQTRPRPARSVTGRRARVLLCASGVSFMIMLGSNIVAVSLPSIARDLNATFADIEWVVSAYVPTFAALLMPSGALADRFGRRWMLIVGLVTVLGFDLTARWPLSPASACGSMDASRSAGFA